ncbi:MAG: T9SS type A sorting domain-containing protein [Bacteroidota bacterium]
MKKHYSIIISLLAIMVLFSYTAGAQNAPKYHNQQVIQKADVSSQNLQLSKINNALLKNNALKSIDSNAVILSQDFSSATFPPTGWTSQIIAGPMNWVRQTYLTLNYNTLDPTGTTFTNGYACANSDSLGTTGENCVLSTTAINCTSYTNVWLSFNEFFREYAASTAKAEVSNNGTTWTTVYEALPGVTVDSSTSNPHFVDVNLTTYAAGQATVYVRFHWTGSFDYYWVVDDVEIYTKPNFDVALTTVSNPNEYVVKPLAHYTSAPLTLAATAKNMGANTINNVFMNVNVYNLSTLTLVQATTSNTLASLAVNATGLLTASTPFTPPADTGIYYIEYIVSMQQTDADKSNDTLFRGFWISDSLFARSDEMYTGFLDGALGFGTGTEGLMGNNYTLTVADKLSHIDAYVTGPAIGDNTQMFVYSTGANGIPVTQLASTAIYTFTAADGQWVSLPLQGGALSLAAGTYYVALKEFTATNNIGLAYTDDNYTPYKVWIKIGTGVFDTLETYGFKGSFIIEPYLVCASFMTNASATMDTICPGQSTTLSAINGTTYSWSPATGLSNPNIANPIANPTSTTTYTVTVTNQYGCTDTDNITIVVNSVTAGASATTNPVCLGQCTNITATGGGTYVWSNPPGGTTATVNVCPTTNTTYTVTVTNNGCTATASATVTVNPIPNVSITPLSPTICSGSGVIITASGATTYSWSPATGLSSTTVANPTASPTTTTTYIVTGTSSGCTSTNSVTVTVNAAPTANAGLDQSITTGTSTTLTGSATGGTPTYTYNWAPAGDLVAANVQNPTTNNLSVTTVFTLTVTDANGCTSTDQVTVTVTGGVLNVTCPTIGTQCQGNCVTLATTVSGGSLPYTYLWSAVPTDATLVGHETEVGPTVCPIVTTVYSLTVTDATVSSAACSFTITVDTPMATDTVVVPEICGNSDGSATVNVNGGTAPYTFLWNTVPVQTTQTATNLIAGTYTVTVTDNVGCTTVESAVVNCVVGIAETYNTGNISIAPNPSDGSFNMTITGFEGKDAMIYICNIIGQTLYSENLSVTTDIYSEKMDLKDLGQGVYFIKVVTKGSVKTVRLIIE